MGLGLAKNQLQMIVVLLAGAFVAVLNATLLTPALPTIMADMGIASTTVQWLTSGYALTEAVIIPLAAYLMGRFSTRRLFIGGMTLFAAGSLVSAVAPVFPLLLLGRVMQACATGFVMPMVFSVILLVIPRERRGSAMGIIGLVIGFAPTIGPSLSGVLVDTVGWRAIFVIVAAVAAIIVACAAKMLKPYGEFRRSRFDLLSVVLSTCGLICLLYGLSSVSSSTNLGFTVGLIVAGIALVGLYAYRQLNLAEPMLRVDILKTVNYRTVVIVIALFQAALIGMETVMPLYIQGVLGQSATVSGLTLLPGALIGAFTGMLAGRLFDKFGVRVPVLIGSAVILCGVLGFTQFRADSPVLLVSVMYAVLAIGIQFTMTPVNTWGVNSLPNEAIQHAQSTSNTINQVAASFGTALLVSVAATVSGAASDLAGVERTFAGYHASFCTTALLAACAIVLILVFVRDKKKVDVPSEAAAASDAQADVRASDGAPFADVPAPSDAFARAADKALSGFTLAQVMNPNAATVSNSACMREVIAILAATNTSGVSVVDPAGKLVGYVTDGDIMRYLARNDFNMSSPSAGVSLSLQDDEDMEGRLAALASLNVMELATKRVVSVDIDTPLDVACAILAKRRIKKMPVTSNGVLVGALSRRNVLHAMMEQIG
ncbi:MAG: MDR family MFS transporter [Coriobacteriales bacterium]|nr:MDR family MFS transporter [Coriobacteriales bacterium]